MMKKFLLIWGLLIFFNASSIAQRNDSLAVIAHNSTGVVLLKWLPGNYELWSLGMKSGYTIERFEVQNVSGKWNIVDKQVLTKEPIKAWDKTKALNEAKNDTELKNLEIIYEGESINENTHPKGVKESAQLQSRKDYLYIVSLFSEVMNNKMAEALGAYYEDRTAQPGKVYLYRVTMNTLDKLSSEVLVDRKKMTIEPNITGFAAKEVHKGVELYWLNPVSSGYVVYDIYRAESKNGPFKKINDLPYIGDVTPVDDVNKIRYTDTFPSLDRVYYYKVQGLSIFGKQGPPTAVVAVKPAYFLQTAPRISGAISLNNEDVMLAWEVDQKDKPYVDHFNVYVSSGVTKPFQRINAKEIKGDTYGYSDYRKNKRTFNYYKVCAFGASGDSTCSLAKDMFLKDTIPPAPPIIISGVCDTNGVVTLKWKKSPEADALGYRVFRTYYTSKEPTRLTKEYMTDTVLVDTVDMKSGWRKVYYTVAAIDEVYGASDLSKYFAVPMPDKIPPVNAVITDYEADYKGVTLTWVNSPSKDVKMQYLMRKSELDFAWQPVKSFKGDSLKVTSYKDSLTQSNIWYEYAMVTEDSSGLKSAMSKGLRIKQPEKNAFTIVKNLQVFVSRDNEMIKLTWDFDLNATGFKIMRSVEGKPVATYKFIPGSKREFYDKWLTPNTQYTYAIIAELPGGRNSLMSPKVTTKY